MTGRPQRFSAQTKGYVMSKYDLQQRVIVITGSTGGFGSALAQALRNKGARLALLDVNQDALRKQAMSLGDESVARAWPANVCDYDGLEQTMSAVATHFGGIDVVIANAGIDTVAPMERLAPEAFDRVIDVNLNGVWRTFKAALPHVKDRRGYLLAISSMAAFVHSPLQASYTASKAGVWAMCDSVRLELRHFGVGVGSVHPTFFRTPMMDDVIGDPAGEVLWEGNQKGLWKMIPLETVVADTIAGIERRADKVVIPKSLALTANAPGFFRRIMERIGYTPERVRRAIELSSSTGWHDPKATARSTAVQDSTTKFKARTVP